MGPGYPSQRMGEQVILTKFEERLSNVPRWNIVRTIQKQTVDQHSFRVAVIAQRLAIDFWDISPRSFETLYLINRYALMHDQSEAFTGDVPSPVGRRIRKKALENEFYNLKQEHPEHTPLVREIVKAADFLEALIFLEVEESMGNNSLRDIKADIVVNFRKHMESTQYAHHTGRLVHQAYIIGRCQQDPLANDEIPRSADGSPQTVEGT